MLFTLRTGHIVEINASGLHGRGKGEIRNWCLLLPESVDVHQRTAKRRITDSSANSKSTFITMKLKNYSKGSIDDKYGILPLFSAVPGQKSRNQDLFNSTHLLSLLKSTKGEKLGTNARQEAGLSIIQQDQTIQKLILQLSQRDAAIEQLEDLAAFHQKILSENLRPTKPNSKDSEEAVLERNHQQIQDDGGVIAQQGKECFMDSFRREASHLKIENQDQTIHEMKQIIQRLQNSLEEKSKTNLILLRSLKLQRQTIVKLRSTNMKLRLTNIECDLPQAEVPEADEIRSSIGSQ